MKKWILPILIILLLLGAAACKKSEPSTSTPTASVEPTSEATPTEEPSAAPTTEAEAYATLAELESAILEKATTVEFMLSEPTEIDLTNADSLSYYLGLSNADGIKEAVYAEPLMSSQAFSLCLIRVESGTDQEALKSAIVNGVNARKWICVAADRVLAIDGGDVILLVMSSEELVTDVQNAFTELNGGNVDKAISRSGEND